MSAGYKAALARFEEAVREHAFIGTQHPGDRAGIELEYEKAKAALILKLQYRAPAKAEPKSKVIAHGPSCGCHYCT